MRVVAIESLQPQQLASRIWRRLSLTPGPRDFDARFHITGAVASSTGGQPPETLNRNVDKRVVTFLMLFLIQRSQNRDALAIHLKLNETEAALDGASNRLIDVEDLTEED